ncbi:MAG: DUF559 domain-containing protein [Microbacteriaceae bacterium]
MTLDDDIVKLGGLAATHELLRLGWSRYRLSKSVHTGSIVRVRQGWYALPETPTLRQRAVRVGGHLTCASAAYEVGLWDRPPPKLHVAVQRNASRLRNSFAKEKRRTQHPDAATVVHWDERHAPSGRFVADIRQILFDMVWCHSPEIVVATVDTALHAGWLTVDDWLAAIACVPARLRKLLRRVDDASESFLESIMRFRLSMIGVPTVLQVRIPGVGRVDLLIGRRLVIELDGWRFHKDRAQFEEDRRRDARLALLGYRVLRFTYRQLMRRWRSVLASVEACVARGDHV